MNARIPQNPNLTKLRESIVLFKRPTGKKLANKLRALRLFNVRLYNASKNRFARPTPLFKTGTMSRIIEFPNILTKDFCTHQKRLLEALASLKFLLSLRQHFGETLFF